jgi:hypothetical protein
LALEDSGNLLPLALLGQWLMFSWMFWCLKWSKFVFGFADSFLVWNRIRMVCNVDIYLWTISPSRSL